MNANKDTCFIVIAPQFDNRARDLPHHLLAKAWRAGRSRITQPVTLKQEIFGRSRFREWLRVGRSHAK
jgi:hypothetical protein